MKPDRGIPLVRGYTIVQDNDFMRFLRRTFPREAPNLVGYWSRQTGRYCVAAWKNRMTGHVQEFFSYGHPSELHQGAVRFIRWYLNEARLKDNRTFRKAFRSSRRAWRRDANDQQADQRARRHRPPMIAVP